MPRAHAGSQPGAGLRRAIVTVCIALPDDSWRPCSAAPAEPDSLEELVELLGERGGFVVPGWRAALLLDAAPDERPTSARPERS